MIYKQHVISVYKRANLNDLLLQLLFYEISDLAKPHISLRRFQIIIIYFFFSLITYLLYGLWNTFSNFVFIMCIIYHYIIISPWILTINIVPQLFAIWLKIRLPLLKVVHRPYKAYCSGYIGSTNTSPSPFMCNMCVLGKLLL